MNSFDKITGGFDIFRRFLSEDKLGVHAEHDTIYAGPDPDVVPEDVKAELEVLHWRPDPSLGCFTFNT